MKVLGVAVHLAGDRRAIERLKIEWKYGNESVPVTVKRTSDQIQRTKETKKYREKTKKGHVADRYHSLR
jgi:hypothetical protein